MGYKKHKCYWCGKIKPCIRAKLLHGQWVCKDCNKRT